jgi:alpha-beta hydrolase superfamily lysophospholipase
MAESTAVAATEEKFEGLGGLKIFFRSWRPAAPRGVVVIVPGFNSHSGYFRWVASELVGAGLAVYAVDLRGRGNSDGERYYIDNFREYLSDVDGVVKMARAREPGLPIFMLGHSAGGVIACVYTLENQAGLAGLVCADFAFQVPAPDFAIAALKGISHLAPHAHVLRLKNEDFSRDPAAVKAMNDDPLIAHETQPTRTVAELARADDRLKKEFPLFTVPVFIFHGTADKVTRPSGSQMFFDNAGSKDKTLKFYEGYFHNPFDDTGKETVVADVRNWLTAHLAKA